MKDKTLQFINNKLQTLDDLSNLNLDINTIIQDLYTTKKLDDALSTEINITSGEILHEAIAIEEINVDNFQIVKSFLEEIQTKLSSISILSLTTATSLDGQSLSKLSRKVKELIGLNIVLEITTNPKILGGAEIAYKGKYKNYTLDHQLNEILKTYKPT